MNPAILTEKPNELLRSTNQTCQTTSPTESGAPRRPRPPRRQSVTGMEVFHLPCKWKTEPQQEE